MQHKKAKAAVEAAEADGRVLSGGIVIEGAHGSIGASLQFVGAAKACALKKAFAPADPTCSNEFAACV